MQISDDYGTKKKPTTPKIKMPYYTGTARGISVPQTGKQFNPYEDDQGTKPKSGSTKPAQKQAPAALYNQELAQLPGIMPGSRFINSPDFYAEYGLSPREKNVLVQAQRLGLKYRPGETVGSNATGDPLGGIVGNYAARQFATVQNRSYDSLDKIRKERINPVGTPQAAEQVNGANSGTSPDQAWLDFLFNRQGKNVAGQMPRYTREEFPGNSMPAFRGNTVPVISRPIGVGWKR
jgi:hypothetical protein